MRPRLLRKRALMDPNVFQGQLEQLSDKGREILRSIEDYKFFFNQVIQVVKNDPELTERLLGRRKDLDQASDLIYDVVFYIENFDITSLYDRQEEAVRGNGTPENQEGLDRGKGASDGDQG